MRVVLDTNVYVSALVYPQGTLAYLFRPDVIRTYHLLISPDILRELAGVLKERFDWSPERRARTLKAILKTSELVVPSLRLDVVQSDPSDDRILECAVAGGADLIVSGDRHLLRLKTYQRIPIVRPIDFLRVLGSKR